jgi:hypothetical protein
MRPVTSDEGDSQNAIQMKRLIAGWIVIFCGAFAMLALLDHECVVDLYRERLQTPLFTGFLTVGSFLLTLKTFILLKLKEELYGSAVYQERFERLRELNSKLTRYGPLTRLGNMLIYAVLLAFCTAIAQLTIGFSKTWIASAFCISLAVVTGCAVLFAWWEIRYNLRSWFSILEGSCEAAGNENGRASKG